MANILIVDDEYAVRASLGLMLKARGHQVIEAGSVAEASAHLDRHRMDLVITDLRLGDGNGLEIVELLRERGDDTQSIVMTAFGSIENAVDAMRLGAYDYLTKPVNPDELLLRVVKVLERKQLGEEVSRLRAQLDGRPDAALIAKSPAMRGIADLIQRIRDQDVPVLITGETGVGKEVLARAIHRTSRRAAAPFVAVNCATLPEDLLDSELFGHVKGAFTGAVAQHEGLFGQADRGTLFLDEVGDVSPRLQAKLLRVLQEGEVRPVGGSRSTRVDVRVITATNRDLGEMVNAGSFRSDLLFRLNVMPVRIPPLRERRDDIAPLVDHFVERLRHKTGRDALAVNAQARRRLSAHDWPGNVRQLRNVLERSFALSDSETLDAESLLFDNLPVVAPPGGSAGGELQPLSEVELAHIRRVLESCDGNQMAAARRLGISRSTLRRKLGLD
ncbi:sigma-54-dependent transcriptional regulator [Acidihalobacter prosperus]|uniref:Sigma-54-dependent Fis family transcriptional regulator n=1 Tax=Acidihalobacter prosperus TaxID=160660 RepID=A0A1A6C7G3_9GAMM|nr:sigma-54 dependent transcriptional regulator [Acidihalobacter prosperus]OBS10501.1 sigma-54-dependent Fis family transcriptional regulator [Acidihalobacter prosperus]